MTGRLGLRQCRLAMHDRTAMFELFAFAALCIYGGEWLLNLFRANLTFVAINCPQEYNEPTIWYPTWLLSEGRNPYTPSEVCGASYAFGPFYHLVLCLLKPLLGVTYSAHRYFDFCCRLVCLYLIGTRVWRASRSPSLALLCVVMFQFYVSRNIMITARPDSLGLMFFLLAVLVPHEHRYSRASCWFGLVCALLGYHCKIYFILAALPVFLGLAVVRSLREALFAAFFFGLTLAGSMALLDHLYPLLHIQAFRIQFNTVTSNLSMETAVDNLRRLTRGSTPLLVCGLLASVTWLFRFPWRSFFLDLWACLRSWRRRLYRGRLPVTGLFLAGLFLLVNGYMGFNSGATFTYQLHLVVPLLFIVASGYLRSRFFLRMLCLLGMVLSIELTCSIQGISDATSGYERLAKVLAPCRDALGVPNTIHLQAGLGQRVYYNGNTSFLSLGYSGGRETAESFVLQTQCEAMTREIQDKLRARSFDVVLLLKNNTVQPFDLSLVPQNYRLTEVVPIPAYFNLDEAVEVWLPKP